MGAWSSSKMGLYFDIQEISQDQMQVGPPTEFSNINLSIDVHECTPPKRHQHQYIVDLDWKLIGSAIKKIGGPFYMYAQKKGECLIGTFLGT